MKEQEYKNTSCVVYPVYFPRGTSVPSKKNLHSTIVFLGDIDEDLLSVEKGYLLEILADVETNVFQRVEVEPKFSLFGEDKDIPVLNIVPNNLLHTTHNVIRYELGKAGIYSPSQFTYRPHVTVDTYTYHANNIPEWVLLGPAELWYGEDKDTIGTAQKVGL